MFGFSPPLYHAFCGWRQAGAASRFRCLSPWVGKLEMPDPRTRTQRPAPSRREPLKRLRRRASASAGRERCSHLHWTRPSSRLGDRGSAPRAGPFAIASRERGEKVNVGFRQKRLRSRSRSGRFCGLEATLILASSRASDALSIGQVGQRNRRHKFLVKSRRPWYNTFHSPGQACVRPMLRAGQ
jgi:hypothetical protein